MSFDVMMFDAKSAPRERSVFDSWFNTLNQWEGDLDYSDYKRTTPALQSFYKELINSYPSLNGPDAPDENALQSNPELENRLTDYSFAPQLIYAAFAWSQAGEADALIHSLAAKHGVGIYHVSTDNAVIFPDGLILQSIHAMLHKAQAK